MKRLPLMLALILTAAFSNVVSAADRPPAKACMCGCAVGEPCRCPTCPDDSACPGRDYDAAYRLAIREHKPLIVFVGQPARAVPGCLVCRQRSFPGVSAMGCVVSRPEENVLLRIADLAGKPTNAQIAESLRATPAQPARQATTALPSWPPIRAFVARGGC